MRHSLGRMRAASLNCVHEDTALSQASPRRRTRTAKPPTPARLRRRALFYLERFAASRARLRTVLWRRAARDAEALELPTAPVAAAIDTLLDDLERLGLLNDRAYAEGRARRLAGKGKPPAFIARELAAHGVARPLIDAVTAELAAEAGDLELATAIAFARRRRLGPFAVDDGRGKPPEKAMAAFARAGFSRRMAERVLNAESVEELDQAAR